MPYIKIPVFRRQETFIILDLPSGKEPIDQGMIEAAVVNTTGPDEWDTVGAVEYGEGSPMPACDAEEYQTFAPFAGRISMADRAKEIGVTTVTLRKWRDFHKVDIFDDDAVRAHIGKQRNWQPQIKPEFKPRLSRA